MSAPQTENSYEAIQQKLTTISKELSDIVKDLKSLEKSSKTRKRTNTSNIIYDISPELAKFIGAEQERSSRQKVLQKISEYVRTNGLQKSTDKRKFSVDASLSKLLGVKKGDDLTFLAINKHVSPLILGQVKDVPEATP
tara:strand:- start:4141 stop:4557 length:417 start_codon:yes stop_codon:yes gene_type:complete